MNGLPPEGKEKEEGEKESASLCVCLCSVRVAAQLLGGADNGGHRHAGHSVVRANGGSTSVAPSLADILRNSACLIRDIEGNAETFKPATRLQHR